MGPYAGVDYNLTVHSRVDSNTFTRQPMPESTLTQCQSRLYLPVRDFGFGLKYLSDIQTRFTMVP